MSFNQYKNKNSVRRKHTRYVQGGDTEVVGDSLGWWEREVFEDDISDEPVIIPKIFDRNPSLMAHVLYGNANLDWVILQYNNIVDDKEFTVGTEIIVPSRTRVWSDFLTKNKKGKNV